MKKYIDFQDVMNTIAKEYFDFMRGAEDISMDGFQLDDDSISSFYVWSQRFEQMSNAFDKLCCYDVYIFYCTSDSFGAVPIRDGEIIDNDKINIPNYFNLSNSLEDDSIFFEISFNESENVYNLKDVSREEVENILNKTITKAYVMEESKMNIYTEILKKYADFLGYTGEIIDDFDTMYEQKQKYDRIIMLNDELDRVKRHPDLYYVIGYDTGFSVLSAMEICKYKHTDNISVFSFKYCYETNRPNVCVEIDSTNNTYKEIKLEDLFVTNANENMS